MAEYDKLEDMQVEVNEDLQEGISPEELEALAGEFSLDDLAAFDNELEFDSEALDAIKPVYSKKEKAKLIWMNNTAFSIIKWCFAGLGLIGLVLYILALIDPGISEALSTTVSAAVRSGLTVVSNLLPISLLEVVAGVAIVGILAYAGFLVFKTIKQKEGVRIAGYWVQFAYVLVAIFGTGFLLFSMTYGVTTNRPKLYNYVSFQEQGYVPNLFREQTLDSSLIYYVDRVNNTAADGIENETIFYTGTGHSRYASTGSSLAEISDAVNACFDLAAEDYPFLGGGHVEAKPMLLPVMYTKMGIGSIYSPITSEILINTDYPEVAVPMQVARAIAKQRGIADDADAKFVSFLVCTKYADLLADMGSEYNLDYIKYAAYMDAYMEVGTIAYSVSPNMHLYCTAALKETAKKDMTAYVKHIDLLYDNINALEFIAAGEKTSTADYRDLPKLLYVDYNSRVNNGDIVLSFNTDDNPVRALSSKFMYSRYLVAYFASVESEFMGEAEDLYAVYNPEAQPNDGEHGV